MTEQELLELFGPEFQDILDELEVGMPNAMDELITAVFSKITFDTIVFGNRITQLVESLLDQGISQSFIMSSLDNDLATGGRIFGELKNNIASAIQEVINQAGRLGQFEEYGREYEEFIWITVAGHKVCPDCDVRGGEIDTWENWIERGLPGSGWSVCRGYCYCVLDPTGSLSDNVKVPDEIREKGYTK